MKRLLLSLAIVMMTLGAAASTVSKAFTIKGKINAIKTYGGVEVNYTPSPAVSVKAFADSKYMNRVSVKLKGGVLEVGFDSSNLVGSTPKVKVELSCPAFGEYVMSGGSDIDVKGVLSVNTLKITTSGGADLTFEKSVTAKTVNVNTSGGSDVEFDSTLKCNTLNVKSSGGADFEAELSAAVVNVIASGGSDVTLSGKSDRVNFIASGAGSIKASRLIATQGSAKASGAGDIRCNVKSLDSNESGAGEIKNRK